MSEFVECEWCEGNGWVMDVYGGPDGPIEYMEECYECNGTGETEEEESE